MEIEDAYIVGDFGVNLKKPSQPILTTELAYLMSGSWIDQGYPFYSGIMRYERGVDLKPVAIPGAILRLRGPRGVCFSVALNDGEPTALGWQPWEVDVTQDLREGMNQVGSKSSRHCATAWDHCITPMRTR